MPFILKEKRQPLLDGTAEPEAPGDLCFIVYNEMMDRWRKSPSWTTIHKLHREFVYNPEGSLFLREVYLHHSAIDLIDLKVAAALAFDVFFGFYGMDYEEKKRRENGDI